jgi:hypothetical protein
LASTVPLKFIITDHRGFYLDPFYGIACAAREPVNFQPCFKSAPTRNYYIYEIQLFFVGNALYAILYKC